MQLNSWDTFWFNSLALVLWHSVNKIKVHTKNLVELFIQISSMRHLFKYLTKKVNYSRDLANYDLEWDALEVTSSVPFFHTSPCFVFSTVVLQTDLNSSKCRTTICTKLSNTGRAGTSQRLKSETGCSRFCKAWIICTHLDSFTETWNQVCILLCIA